MSRATSPAVERPTLQSYLDPAPGGMRAFRKKVALMTGMRGAFSGIKKGPAEENHVELARAITTRSDDDALVLLDVYVRHHPDEVKTIRAPPSEEPLAYIAATHSQWKTTQKLLEHGAAIGDHWDKAVSHTMRVGGDERALPLLVRYLADHTAPEAGAGADAEGNTLLHTAASTGCGECCKELLAASWDPQRTNAAGQTADVLAAGSVGEEHAVTHALQEARRAAELGLPLGRVGQRRKWASEYKASVDKKDTEEAQKALAEKKGVVQSRREWASNYKANVTHAETEAMQKELAEAKGTVQAKHQWVQNYKADVKRSEMEEMQKHLGDKKNIVSERKQWVDTYKSPSQSSRPTGTMSSSDAQATIGSSTSALRQKWSEHETSGGPPSPRRNDNALSSDDAQRVIGSGTSALRQRWQNQGVGSPTASAAESAESPPKPTRLDMGSPDAATDVEVSSVPPMPAEDFPSSSTDAGEDAGEDEYDDMEVEVTGKPLGFQLGEFNDLVTVYDIRAEGNAAKAGIEKDDVLLAINGTKLVGSSGADALHMAQTMLMNDETFPATIHLRRFVFDDEDVAEEE